MCSLLGLGHIIKAGTECGVRMLHPVAQPDSQDQASEQSRMQGSAAWTPAVFCTKQSLNTDMLNHE